MRKIASYFLFPFSLIYGTITWIRNKFFDWGFFPSYSIPGKSICVGNLSLGGTGKTPHVAYLASLLLEKHSLAILSRGYGRKTKGFLEANSNATAAEIGDEPLLYFKRFSGKIRVAVAEKRKLGIEKLQEKNAPDVILLDDAFQHRHVKAGLNILLTEFDKPFYTDFVVPMGRLREFRSGKKRADLIVVTKCPLEISTAKKEKNAQKLGFPANKVFYSSIQYGELIPFGSAKTWTPKNILLVTGIANPTPLLKHLQKTHSVELLSYSDHYQFTEKDLHEIHKKFGTFAPGTTAIVSTEKDYMRLSSLEKTSEINKHPWFYQEIAVQIDREKDFITEINKYVDTI